MAVIVINYDTQEKSLSVVQDGQRIENVVSVECSKSYDGDKYYMQVMTEELMEEDNMVKVTKIIADEQSERSVESVESVVDTESLSKALLGNR